MRLCNGRTYRPAATLEALSTQLVPDGRYIGTALGDALAKVVAIGIQQHGPTAARSPFGVLACPREVAHGPLVQIRGPRDHLERQALRSKPHHVLVACQSCCASINAQLLPGHQRHCALGRGGLRLRQRAVSYTHLRAHETDSYLVCRLLLEKK